MSVKALTPEQFIAQAKPNSVTVTAEMAAERMLLKPTAAVLAKLRERRAGKTLAEHAHDLGLCGGIVPTMIALEEYIAKLERAVEPPPATDPGFVKAMNEARAKSRGDW